MNQTASLSEIILFLGDKIIGVHGDNHAVLVSGLVTEDEKGKDRIDWVNSSHKEKQMAAEHSPSQIVITDSSVSYSDKIRAEGKILLRVESPRDTVGMIGNRFFISKHAAGIHPSSVVSNKAEIDTSVYVGPNAVIGACVIGKNTIIHDSVSIADDVLIGDNVEVFSGSVLGTNGLGCFRDKNQELHMFPHLGKLIIKDNVIIGANCSLARGSLSNTVIGAGTKINALCFIAHNCVIGNNVHITGSTMLNGSVKVGDNSTIFSHVIIRDQAIIGANSIIGMGSVVTKNVPSDEVWVGNPARFLRENEK